MNHRQDLGLALIWKDENVTSELEVALSAAKEAGEVLRKGFGWQHSVRYKGEVDLVTEVDEQAEQVIREILLGAFPAYGMLAEEGGALVGEADARWIVDPLDGTTNYAHGLHIFCVSIALERSGEVVLGVATPFLEAETFSKSGFVVLAAIAPYAELYECSGTMMIDLASEVFSIDPAE